jgi:hypothetical protein
VDGGEPELVPGEWVLPVEEVGPIGVAWVPIDGDADEVPGDRCVACVVDQTPLPGPVRVAVVAQFGLVVLDHKARRVQVPWRDLA